MHASIECLFSRRTRRASISSRRSPDGADQIAAEAALAARLPAPCGPAVHAADYRRDLGDDAAESRSTRCSPGPQRVLELPGDQADETEGYAMAGPRDDRPLRCPHRRLGRAQGARPGRHGGGRRNGDRARHAGHPLAARRRTSRRKLLWAAFDPVVDTSGVDPMSERPLDPDACRPDAHGAAAAAARRAGAALRRALLRRADPAIPGARPNMRCFWRRAASARSGSATSREEHTAQMIQRGVADYQEKCVAAARRRRCRSTCWRRPMAGPTISRRTSPRTIAAATSSASCSAASRCAWASPPSCFRT